MVGNKTIDDGGRAIKAAVRPHVRAYVGTPTVQRFNMDTKEFVFQFVTALQSAGTPQSGSGSPGSGDGGSPRPKTPGGAGHRAGAGSHRRPDAGQRKPQAPALAPNVFFVPKLHYGNTYSYRSSPPSMPHAKAVATSCSVWRAFCVQWVFVVFFLSVLPCFLCSNERLARSDLAVGRRRVDAGWFLWGDRFQAENPCVRLQEMAPLRWYFFLSHQKGHPVQADLTPFQSQYMDASLSDHCHSSQHRIVGRSPTTTTSVCSVESLDVA